MTRRATRGAPGAAPAHTKNTEASREQDRLPDAGEPALAQRVLQRVETFLAPRREFATTVIAVSFIHQKS